MTSRGQPTRNWTQASFIFFFFFEAQTSDLDGLYLYQEKLKQEI